MAGDGGGGVDWESLAEATSGAIGSLVSTTVLYPLDTCKTKFQAELQTHQGAQKYRYCGSIPFLIIALLWPSDLYDGARVSGSSEAGAPLSFSLSPSRESVREDLDLTLQRR